MTELQLKEWIRNNLVLDIEEHNWFKNHFTVSLRFKEEEKSFTEIDLVVD